MVFGPWVSNVRRWSCDTWIYELCLPKIFLFEWVSERTPGSQMCEQFAFQFVTFYDPTHFTRCLLCSLITKNSLSIFNRWRTFCSIFQWNQSKTVDVEPPLLALTSWITHTMPVYTYILYMRASVSAYARVRHVLSAIHWPPHFFFFFSFSDSFFDLSDRLVHRCGHYSLCFALRYAKFVATCQIKRRKKRCDRIHF